MINRKKNRVKAAVAIVFLLASFALTAQKTGSDSVKTKLADSLQIKLGYYKELFDNGVISEDEYNKMKGQLTGAPVENKKVIKEEKAGNAPQLGRADTMPMPALRERYRSKVIAGSVLSSVGLGFIVGDILYSTLTKVPSDSANEVASKRTTSVALGVIGGLASVGGTVFLVLGLKDKAIYKRRGKELSMVLTGNEIGFAYVF